jgi:hypothetical protein
MGLQGGLFKGLSGSLARGTIRGVTLRSSRFTLKIHRPGQTETQSIQVLSVNLKTPKTSGKSTQEASTTSVAREAAFTGCLRGFSQPHNSC